MAASPKWKVYDASGRYRAACHDIEDAAILVAAIGTGATIRFGHRKADTVWNEGSEEISASESYDIVAATADSRIPHYTPID